MQARNAMVRRRGLNRMTAGAIGLALLAVATIGALILSDPVTLPSLGGGEQATIKPAVHYSPSMREGWITLGHPDAGPTNQRMDWAELPFFADASTEDHVEALGEASGFDTVVGLTLEEIRVIEENIWERETHAQVAGRDATVVPALTYAHRLFLEENIWNTQGLTPPVDTGEPNYGFTR